MSEPSALHDTAERLPAPPLRPFLARYAGYRFTGLEPGVTRGLPSRHVTLMIGLGEPFEIRGAGTFPAFVAGLHDAAAIVARTEQLEGIHAFLHPLGVRALLGLPASELSRAVVPLDAVLGGDARELRERLAEAPSWRRRFDLLDALFLRVLRPREVDDALQHAWCRLLFDAGRTRIEHLARDVGWSRRHLGQRFRTELGVSPKTAARIFRFEHACARIRNCAGPLADVALASGFHDQPHMTREWRALTGLSPRAWIAEELPFVQDYELAGLDPRG